MLATSVFPLTFATPNAGWLFVQRVYDLQNVRTDYQGHNENGWYAKVSVSDERYIRTWNGGDIEREVLGNLALLFERSAPRIMSSEAGWTNWLDEYRHY